MGSRQIFAPLLALLLGLAITTPAESGGSGYGPFPPYSGPKLPASAAGFVLIAGRTGLGNINYTAGYFLDTDADDGGRADVADTAGLTTDFIVPNGEQLLGVYVSPSDPNIAYVYASAGFNQATQNRDIGLAVVRKVAGQWQIVTPFTLNPPNLRALGGVGDTIDIRGFSQKFSHPITIRSLTGGRGDAVLVIATFGGRGGANFESRYALWVDGPDPDLIADHWTTDISLSQAEPITLTPEGKIVVRLIVSNQKPDFNRGFATVIDTNGDLLPDTIEPGSESLVTSLTTINSGQATDMDLGADRINTNPVFATANLNSRRYVIPGSGRDAFLATGSVTFEASQLFTMPDGSLLAWGSHDDAPPLASHAVVIARDITFDRLINNSSMFQPHEIFPLFFESEIPNPHIQNVSVAELQKVALTSGSARVTFRDFGEYPGGEAFTFRFGSDTFDSLTVAANGTVRFGPLGAVTGPASSDALRARPGTIAPAWSDRWDTSALEVFAGYAPVQKSFASDARVLAFVVEWRGLRDQAWGDTGADAERRFAMRLLLFSDGTWRTDYGAIGEVTGTPFVVGYSGPGAATVTSQLDASMHSWGGQPAGTGGERFLAESFTGPNDLDHLWLRWRGYPERSDTPGPAPKVIGLKFANGKLSMAVAGSDIVQGAVVIIAGETFELTKNAKGTKWVVKKSARSTPSVRSIAQIVGEGNRTFVVVNPDGQQSAPATLP